VTDFVQLVAAGTAIGSIYAMTSIGFVLLWQTSGSINFAQGEFSREIYPSRSASPTAGLW